jgi:hypothetical protein
MSTCLYRTGHELTDRKVAARHAPSAPDASTGAVGGVIRPRELYGRFEARLGPVTTELTHSVEFAHAVTIFGETSIRLRRAASRLSARVWHAVNLPAGTDVQRLRTHLGSLDRDVRMLTLELERQRTEARRRGDSGSHHD